MKTVVILLTVISIIQSARLLGLVELFRHGARGPLTQDPLDPHNWKDEEMGQLTAAGMRMHFLLGHELRSRYVKTSQWDNDPKHILPESLINANIEVHSDNFERCILSAQSQLTGLYPPGTGPILENEVQMKAVPPYNISDLEDIQKTLSDAALPFQIQPAPVHVQDLDNLIVNADDDCTRVHIFQKQYEQSQEHKDWVQKNYVEAGIQEELERIFTNTGNIDWNEAKRIYDWAQVDKAEGFSLPEGFTDSLYWKLYDLNGYYFFKQLLPNDEVVALETSGFWKDTLKFFDDLLSQHTQVRMKLWSSHDTGVAPVVKSMKLLPINITSVAPPFASNLIIELYQNDYDNDGYVIFKYQDIERKSQFCDGKTCTYQQFKNFTSKYIYNDIKSACQVTFYERMESRHLISLGSVGIVLLGIIGLIVKKVI